MTNAPITPTTGASPARRTPVFIHVAAWAVPVLMLTEFALLAAAPVVVIVIGTAVNARARALRWWGGLLGVVYAIPMVVWLVRDDAAPSLSKDIHPVLLAVVVAASIAFLVKIYTRRTR